MEQWKIITGFEKYEVSNFGNVRNSRTKRILSQHIYKDGYNTVMLFDDDLKQKRMRVHRLVAFVFVGNPPDEERIQVNHIDGNKQNNRFDNLEWCTPKENINHAIDTGLCEDRKGETNPTAKLTEDDVRYIRSNFVKGDSTNGTVGLSKQFSVSPSAISEIISRKKWNHI